MEDTLISLDDGKTWNPWPASVRFMKIMMHPEKDDTVAELHFNITEEGLIMDVIDPSSSEVLGTSSETFDEIVDRLAS